MEEKKAKKDKKEKKEGGPGGIFFTQSTGSGAAKASATSDEAAQWKFEKKEKLTTYLFVAPAGKKHLSRFPKK